MKIKKTYNAGTYQLSQISAMENQYEMKAEMNLSSNDVAGFNMCMGEGRKVSLSYDASTGYLTLDRTNSSDVKIKFFDRVPR